MGAELVLGETIDPAGHGCELAEIQARWLDVAEQVEDVEVGSERTDIDVGDVLPIRLPAWRNAPLGGESALDTVSPAGLHVWSGTSGGVVEAEG